MTRWSRKRVAAAAATMVVAVALAVALAGAARGIALYAYVLALTGLGVVVLGSRMGKAWRATPPFERLIPVRVEREPGVLQLDQLAHRVAGGNPNEYDVHHRLRPLVQEIAAARLATGHGVELADRPERARELVGPRTWELIRPDRPPPQDRFAYAWSTTELGVLIDELERL